MGGQRGMGCKPSKEGDGSRDAKLAAAVQATPDFPRAAQKTRTWTSTFEEEPEDKKGKKGKKSAKRPMTTTSGDTELKVGPKAWHLKRISKQTAGAVIYAVNETYEGLTVNAETRDDQLLYTLRTQNATYRAEGGGYTFTAQVTYDGECEVKGNKYPVNSAIGECKAGDEVMVWNLSIDGDEVWSQDRAGDSVRFRSVIVQEDKNGEKEVVFFPDEKGHWANIELSKIAG